MRSGVRWFVIVVVVAHGLVHVLGAEKGLGWADVSQLTQPISASLGVAWFVTAVLVVAAGMLSAMSVPWWWAVGAVAGVASQTLIITAWSDARAGTLANILLLLAVVYGYASHGPRSYRAEFRRRSHLALAAPLTDGVVTEADLRTLPAPVAAYVRQSGAVGQDHVVTLHADISGRIRSAPSARWMTFHGEQVNTFGSDPTRLFFIDATMLGVPLDVLHVFVGRSATMRVKAGSLVRIVHAAGPALDQAETVTLFNDLCVLAPAALVDAPVAWEAMDEHHTRGTLTRGLHQAVAVLVFNDDHELVDFISDDRLQVSSHGQTAVAQRWSTPLRGSRTFGADRIASGGNGRWHAPEPDGEYTYIEFQVDDITYNSGRRRRGNTGPHRSSVHEARAGGSGDQVEPPPPRDRSHVL
ncbi:MAG: DUF6544 family protein [Ilumatobacteraceae bacterium]